MTKSSLTNEAHEAFLALRPLRLWFVTVLILIIMLAAVAAASVDMSPMLSALLDQALTSRGAFCALLLLYTLLLVLPFVPGAELGLALLLLFGAAVALPIYIATVLALSVAFVVGRLASGTRNLELLREERRASEAILAFMDGGRQRPWILGLGRFRWLAVALLLNMPGNTMIGGGGGIAMAVGYCRTFSYPDFLACAAVAVAPVPALFLIAEVTGFGEQLSQWTEYLV